MRLQLKVGIDCPILIQLAVEGPPVDAEDLGGARLVLSGHAQSLDDIFPFQFIQGEPTLLAPRNERRRAGLVPDPFREIIRDEVAALGQRDRPFDRILEFPRIPRPLVGGQNGERLRRDVERQLPRLVGNLVQEVLDEQRDVEWPLPQRRNVEVDDVETPVEVLAEAPLLDLLLEVAVGGGDDPQVDLAFAIVADGSFNTALVRWSRTTGATVQTLYAPGGYSFDDAELTPDGSEVWVCNSSFGSPGVRRFAATTGAATGSVLLCTLPPKSIAFPSGPVLDVPPLAAGARVALSASVPNPARGPVRLSFAMAPGSGAGRVEVLDLAGRLVRTWEAGPGATGSAIEWDLADAAGRRVAPGVYRVRLRMGSEQVSRSVLVLQ